MTTKEAVNWIINVRADIGKIEHQELWHYEQALSEIMDVLEDAVPVVRCGECRYWDRSPSCSATPQYHACKRRIYADVHTMRDDFCSCGERKDGDGNG